MAKTFLKWMIPGAVTVVAGTVLGIAGYPDYAFADLRDFRCVLRPCRGGGNCSPTSCITNRRDVEKSV